MDVCAQRSVTLLAIGWTRRDIRLARRRGGSDLRWCQAGMVDIAVSEEADQAYEEDVAAYDEDDFEELSEDETAKVTKSFGDELRHLHTSSGLVEESLSVPAVQTEEAPSVAAAPVQEEPIIPSDAPLEEQLIEPPLAPLGQKSLGLSSAAPPTSIASEKLPAALPPTPPLTGGPAPGLGNQYSSSRPSSGRRRSSSRPAEVAPSQPPVLPVPVTAAPSLCKQHASRRPRQRACVESPRQAGDTINGVTDALALCAGAGKSRRDRDGPVTEFESSPCVRTISASSGSTAAGSKRVVRGKVGVTDDISPPVQGNHPHPSEAGREDPSRPVWLQGGISREPYANRRGGGANSPLQTAPRGRGGHCSPEVGAHAGGAREGSRIGAGAARGWEEFGARSRLGSACGDDDRKAKRLQQEVQRLQQRLQEAELFSPQDDGVPRFALDDVELGSQIAQGGFSSVHFAVWHGTPCALKKIFDPVITDSLKAEFENEVRMLRRLRHPNIVTLMAVCRQPPALSILTEIVEGGSLFELLHCRRQASGRPPGPRRDPGALLPLVRQAANALAYVHAMAVVHRDIKTQNVLLTAGPFPCAKLCDFGLARMRSELCTGEMQWAGTAQYMAPEIFAKRRYTEAVDVFAFGVMTWEVVAIEIPHANLEPEDIGHRVQSKECAGLPVTPSWPRSLKTLLKACLAMQAEERPSMAEAAKSLTPVLRDFPPPD